MRLVALDTETTGMEIEEDHRLIEIGCVEILDGIHIGDTYRQLIDPEREVSEGSRRIHGMSRRDLMGQPIFADIADEFLEFLGGSDLVIHNAEFDLKFINHELDLCGRPPLTNVVHDTIVEARKRWPGRASSLDALCRRFDVDNKGRVLHGALIDADLLARVYIEMHNERAPTLQFFTEEEAEEETVTRPAGYRPPRQLISPSRLEAEAHERFITSKIANNSWNYSS